MLELAWMCGQYHLPETGGVLDQDYKTMRLMNAARNAHAVIERARRTTGKDIHNLPAGDKQTLAALRKMGISIGME